MPLSTSFIACVACHEFHQRLTPARVAYHGYGGPRDDEHAFVDRVCQECLDEHYRHAKREQVKAIPETPEMIAWENATDEERRVAWEGE